MCSVAGVVVHGARTLAHWHSIWALVYVPDNLPPVQLHANVPGKTAAYRLKCSDTCGPYRKPAQEIGPGFSLAQPHSLCHLRNEAADTLSHTYIYIYICVIYIYILSLCVCVYNSLTLFLKRFLHGLKCFVLLYLINSFSII